MNGNGRSEKDIFQQEILNVKANRYMTAREKDLKIKQLEKLIKPKN